MRLFDDETLDALSPEPTFSVRELCEAVRVALAVTFPDEVWVRGEIRDLKRPKTGHVYFDLVETGGELGRAAEAKVPVALFANHKFTVNGILRRAGGGVRMTDGVEVRIRGSLQYHPPTGRISFVMTAIDPAYTLGQLAEARERLLRQLAAEGLLEANRSRPLGPAPLHVGLVTSHGSAAEHDFLDELARSGLSFRVRCVDTRVQGADAARSVVAAMSALGRSGVDVIALVRGGGARTELAVFDDETVARAIATSPVPVWTGIGHEIDRAVADEVAHQAHKTPTACASALVEAVRLFLGDLDRRWAVIATRATARLDREHHRVGERDQRLRRGASASLRRAEDALTTRARRVGRESDAGLRRATRALDSVAAIVAAFDPERALARGWSITRRGDGRLVRAPTDVAIGDLLVTGTGGGELWSRVTDERRDD